MLNKKLLIKYLKKINIKKSFLKIDVEGYELNVLKGSKKKIKEVKYILIEDQYFNQYKNDFNKVKKFLKKNNFEILKILIFPLFIIEIFFLEKKPRNFFLKVSNFFNTCTKSILIGEPHYILFM